MEEKEERKVCIYCGESAGKEDIFCGKCGKKIEEKKKDQRLIWLGVLGIVLILIVALFYLFYLKPRQEREEVYNLYERESYEEVVNRGQALLGRSKEDQKLWEIIFISYYKVGNYDGALEFYDSWQEENKTIKNQPIVLITLGNIYRAKEDGDKAVRYYEKGFSQKVNTEEGYIRDSYRNYLSIFLSVEDFSGAEKRISQGEEIFGKESFQEES